MPRAERWEDGKIAFDCPGCGMQHAVTVERGATGPCWGWNGSMDLPTFTPSILVRWDFGPERTPKVCHSFVTDGRIQFLGDCTHALAGQTVDLPEVAP
jgi:hypothetical protein